jgi:hypothetical protein
MWCSWYIILSTIDCDVVEHGFGILVVLIFFLSFNYISRGKLKACSEGKILILALRSKIPAHYPQQS